MSALIRHLVAAKNFDRAFVARREKLIAEAKGADGVTPAHEWKGTKLRFQNPDGTWGEWVDLKGDDGKPGKDGERVVMMSGGGGSRFDPSALDELPDAPTLTDFLLIERDGVSYRISLDQLATVIGGGGVPANTATVNGSAVKVAGINVTVT